jgi:hypothetical protein
MPLMTITREDPRFWDVRTIERRIRKGQLTRKDVEKHTKGLPDVAEKGATVELSDEDFDDEDDLDDVDDTDDAVEASAPDGE